MANIIDNVGDAMFAMILALVGVQAFSFIISKLINVPIIKLGPIFLTFAIGVALLAGVTFLGGKVKNIGFLDGAIYAAMIYILYLIITKAQIYVPQIFSIGLQ